MKVSENVIVHYCDFCSPQKKVKATDTCGICFNDVCHAHRNFIPVEKQPLNKHPLGENGLSPIRVFVQYRFVPVCPDCSFQSFFSLIEALSRKAGYASPKDMAR